MAIFQIYCLLLQLAEGGMLPLYKVVDTNNMTNTKRITLDELLTSWQALQPFDEDMKLRLNRKFTVEYNYNSNHIEGNTLTYGQTELLLMFGKVSGEGNLKDFNDMKASAVGLKMVEDEIRLNDVPLTQNFIRQLHLTLLREDYTVYRTLPGGIETSYVIHAGQYKTRPNSVITRYGDRFEYASPEETPAFMTDLVDWYNTEEKTGIMSPVELAALFHYRYIRLHPFEDGNGRIARLLVNYILSRHGWPMIVVRSRKKQEYIEALHKTDLVVGNSPSDGAYATLAQVRPFMNYFKKLVYDEISNDIDFIKKRGTGCWWYDGERIKFRSPNGSRLLSIIHENPYVTYAEMSRRLGINMSAVQKLIKSMTEKGYIWRNEKNGNWHLFAIR